MTFHALVQEETKATSQHQITIPKKIWKSLDLEVGARFDVVLTEDKKIVVTPKRHEASFELTDEEWRKLFRLAHSDKNLSRSFNRSKDAIAYLRKL